MASISCLFSVIPILAILFLFPNAVTSVPESQLNSMIAVLRARGYNLFCNAITTSDLRYDVLSGVSFTFFAPTDSSLFALDMTNTASDYVSSLRYHIVPRRLAVSDLRSLPSVSSVPTLVTNQEIRIERRLSPWSDVISIDGVEVVVPGLFYGPDIAVHGLGGILSLRSQSGLRQGSPSVSPTAVNFPGNDSFQSPPVNQYLAPSPNNLSGNPSFQSPDFSHLNLPPVSSSSGSQSPSSDETDNPTVGSSVPEPAGFDGFFPAYSKDFAPNTGSPAPSLYQIDNPAVPSPSADDVHDVNSNAIDWESIFPGIHDLSLAPFGDNTETKGEVPDKLPNILPEQKFAGTTATTFGKSRPLDENTFDCPVTDDETQIRFHLGSLYTLHHLIDSSITCAHT